MTRKKNVVFIGTRNMYPHMVPPILSLLDHTKVDMIYLVIEDDEFPYELPCKHKVINASGQTFFLPDSINYKNKYTYLCLCRVAFTKLLPDVDMVLSLDDDIIITDDISPMWDVDLTGKWLAAVPETYKWGVDTECYYNCGIVMYNLAQMRKDGIDDKLIAYLNETEVTFSDQVAINHYLASNQDKATKYDIRYNEFCNSGQTDNPAIVHYCGYKDWMFDDSIPRHEYLRKYQQIFYRDYPLKRSAVMKNSSIRYMIHCCPARMWFVEDFLIPELLSQGIPKETIHIWNDTEGWGNLMSFAYSMKWVGETCDPKETIWHIQDDILPHTKFATLTSKIQGIVAYGFAHDKWQGANVDVTGITPLDHAWTSFQAIAIPNRLAAEFWDWFHYLDTKTFRLMPYTKDRKHDDTVFGLFLKDRHPTESVMNCYPNLCEHIDYAMGGSTLWDNGSLRRLAYWWDEDDRTREWEKRIAKYLEEKR